MLDKLISLFDPNTLLGAIGIGLCALFIATAIAILIRRFTLRVEARMSDVTVLRFISMVAQLSTYLIAAVALAGAIGAAWWFQRPSQSKPATDGPAGVARESTQTKWAARSVCPAISPSSFSQLSQSVAPGPA